ncbi:MAG: hypothetical protein RLZZ214_522 [Verrucomicrobiota bacterium]|jgi:autotransporter-associated beta strand protein
MKTRSFLSPLTRVTQSFAAALLLGHSAHGASYTWDSDADAAVGTPAKTTAGSGTWNTANTNWNLAGTAVSDTAWAPGSDAVFAGSDGTHAITVGSALGVNNLTFSNSGYTLSASSATNLTGTVGTNLVTVASGATATLGNNVAFTSGFNAAVISLVGTDVPGGTAGTLIIDNGGTVSATFGNSLVYIGSRANSTGTLKATTVQVNTGGTISSNGSVVANGLLKVEGGAVNAVTGIIAIGNYADGTSVPGSASLTINSGTVTVATAANGVRFGSSGGSTNTGGTLNLNGGTLTTNRIYTDNIATSSTVNFNGGTLKASATSTIFLGSAIDNAIVKAGGAIIDTNTFDVTIVKDLTHDSGLGATADGGLTKKSAGKLTLSGNNTYTGLTDVQAGTLSLGRSGGTIADAAAVQVSGGTLDVANSDTVGAVTLSSGTISGAGTLTGSSYSLTNTGTVSAALGGSGSALTKTGAGTVTLSGNHAYTGATNINAGKLIVDGNISTSTLTTVNNTGTLGGIGTVAALTAISGGTVSPGNSAGILSAGNTDLQAGSILALELGGASAGVNYDRLNVTGSATLDGLLNLTVTGTYANNDLLFLLVNDGADAITGAFSNYAEGANFTLGSQAWKLTYLANNTGLNAGTFTSGNDVALMAIPEPNAAMLVGGLGMLALLRRRRA